MVWEVVTSYDRTGITSTTSVDEQIFNTGITVFPAPAHDVVTVSLPSAAAMPVAIRIHDVEGTLVATSVVPQGASSTTVSLAHAAAGIYVVTAASDESTKTTMLVKR